jgi:hypothetical protein
VKLVITLKSGVQIRSDVDSFTTTTGKLAGELHGVRWVSADNAKTSLNWADLSEVAAIHAEHEPDDYPEDPGHLGDGSQS